jgi:hypothetical protein
MAHCRPSRWGSRVFVVDRSVVAIVNLDGDLNVDGIATVDAQSIFVGLEASAWDERPALSEPGANLVFVFVRVRVRV